MNNQILKTKRLLLRSLNLEDSPEILLLRSDKIVNQYIDREKTLNVKASEKFINSLQFSFLNKSLYYWGICMKNNSKLIGTICLWNFSKDKKTAEIGFDLLPKFHNKGIMTEALGIVINFGFNSLNLDKIEAFTHIKNTSSIKLLSTFKFLKNNSKIDRKNSNNIIYELVNDSPLIA